MSEEEQSSDQPDQSPRASRWGAARADRPDTNSKRGRDAERAPRGSDDAGERRARSSGGTKSGGRPADRGHASGQPTSMRGGPAGQPDRRDRGPRSWEVNAPGRSPERARIREPELPDEITGKELDRQVWTQLRTLSKDNALGVARHLVMTAEVLDDDVDLALEHAEHAAKRAGRVPAVREALGLVRYRRGEFSDALREFRTARRLSGSDHLLAYMADCERGLGRPDRALELAASAEAKNLGEGDNIELAIVVSGVRRDLGQPEAAVMCLRIPALQKATDQPWAARLFYAYADALLATGDEDGAHEWFRKALDADVHEQTDAAFRLGLEVDDEFTDLLDAGEDEPSSSDGGGEPELEADREADSAMGERSDDH